MQPESEKSSTLLWYKRPESYVCRNRKLLNEVKSQQLLWSYSKKLDKTTQAELSPKHTHTQSYAHTYIHTHTHTCACKQELHLPSLMPSFQRLMEKSMIKGINSSDSIFSVYAVLHWVQKFTSGRKHNVKCRLMSAESYGITKVLLCVPYSVYHLIPRSLVRSIF